MVNLVMVAVTDYANVLGIEYGTRFLIDLAVDCQQSCVLDCTTHDLGVLIEHRLGAYWMEMNLRIAVDEVPHLRWELNHNIIVNFLKRVKKLYMVRTSRVC